MQALALTAILVLAAGAAGAQSVSQGRALVRRNCGMCHAVNRSGDSPNSQAPKFRELHQRYAIDDLAEALVEGILVGHPEMPEFRFTPEEVQSIVKYLKSIQTDQRVHLDRGQSGPG